MEHDEEEPKYRHKVGIDCLSLLDDDGVLQSAEESYLDEATFMEILRDLETEREKFIALGLLYGFNKENIAFMLKIDPSRVTRWNQKMRLTILAYLKARK